MENNQESSSELEEKQSLSPIELSELCDIFVNKGILQEANRTFFNPLGFVLELNEYTGKFSILKSTNDAGPVIETIDNVQKSAFRNYSEEKYKIRQKFYGFIIQVRDVLRAAQIKSPIATVKQRRLAILMAAIDGMAYQCKIQMAKKNQDKDDNTVPLIMSTLYSRFNKHVTNGNWINVANYATLIHFREQINKELDKLTKDIKNG